MIRFIAIILALSMALVVNVAAAAQQQRIRGTIENFDQSSLTIATRSGDTVKLMLGDAKYVHVVKSDLSKISSGSFIGAATTKIHGTPVAIEVVVFPESMAGTGEGHYAWDKLKNTMMSGSGTVSSSMTNATVKSSKAMGQAGQQGQMSQQGMVSTDMTNATVKTSKKTERGTRLLTVTYSGGTQMQILVPPTAPIVAFEPKDRSILKQGAHVFIVAAKADGELSAKFVAVGKNGLNPPM